MTGATGFTGGVLARRLKARGCEVRVLVRDLERASPLAEAGCELVQGDLVDDQSIGQAVSAYVVDLIANALMLLAAGASLTNREISASGWLAGAWGFAFCLNYRSFFGRLRLQSEGTQLEEPSAVLTILGVTLVIAALAFLFSMWLARPRRP